MKFYHGTSEESWEQINEEGILFGRRYVTDGKGNSIKEVDRCTYLSVDVEEAKCYGEVVLEVEYNPFNSRGRIKRNRRNVQLNNYSPESWQIRVYEPIPIENIRRIR